MSLAYILIGVVAANLYVGIYCKSPLRFILHGVVNAIAAAILVAPLIWSTFVDSEYPLFHRIAALLIFGSPIVGALIFTPLATIASDIVMDLIHNISARNNRK